MDTDSGLPASLESAWGLRERPSRGPKRALSLERIVKAGVAVADQDGLDAVSMSRVATELGTSAMSLYRYVKAKDELLTLMTDAVYADLDTASVTGEDWRADLSALAWRSLEALRAHAWVVRIPIAGPPLTPHQLRWMEAGLRALRGTPLDAEEKMSTMLLISGLVRNEGTLAVDLGRLEPDPEEIMPQYKDMLLKILHPAEFPELISIVASGMMDKDDGEDDTFQWSLERVLDGVAALISSKE
ncbi:TetR/AcrR family transcriptional regulator [Actinokineospora enzanensis]|uniref:TetR/AcrR family transcriptional regulator n=1 Tax=Actinokineospora enzanensis TaxID=155975 RepID=UPI00039D0C67|nr:TetR/AcrR family transcriptional regulator [Actinokineospora enzanensis]